MKKIKSILLVAIFGLSLPLVPVLTSCANHTNLASTGVYAGDATLYNADKVITGTYQVFDTFVKWEYTNRPFLAATPAVKQTADKVRVNGEQWIKSAQNLREAYKANPTDEARTKLEQSLAILRAVLNEIATYYVANLTPPAPPANP